MPYLRARSLHGRFLIRIEDLDTPRCQPENSLRIVQEISSLGFDYDDDILYQSHNLARYEERLNELADKKLLFYCTCTREQLKHRPCSCRFENNKNVQNCAIRFIKDEYALKGFEDSLLGYVPFHIAKSFGERYMILKRRDGIFSYNFACVVDDIDSKVTEIVRGCDLLDVSVPQLTLYEAFNATKPKFLHLPLALEDDGRKLSKQNHAPAILDLMSPTEALRQALLFLGQDTSYIHAHTTCKEILYEAIARFSLSKIPHDSYVPNVSKLCF